MKNHILTAVLALFAAGGSLFSQGLPRLFLDVPTLYVRSLDVNNFGDRVGAGTELNFNVGTHYLNARAGGGAIFSVEPKASDFKESFVTGPFARIEAGVGPNRTNGDQCVRHHARAWTAQLRGGYLYDFEAKKGTPIASLELGYFYIRDFKRNAEIFLRSDFQTSNKLISVDFGFRRFYNLKALGGD